MIYLVHSWRYRSQHPNPIVIFVREIDLPRFVYADTRRRTDVREKSETAVASEAVYPVSRDCRNYTRGCVNLSYSVIQSIGNVYRFPWLSSATDEA